MKRTPLRRTPFKRSDHVIVRRRRTLARIGKKGKEWAKVRRELKVELSRLGVTRCEFRFEGCTDDYNLSLAHSLKRNELGKGEERERLIRECGVACLVCHRVLDEVMTHEEMARTVRQIIERRELAA